MHLGILQCDSVPPELRERFGDYPAMFMDLLQPVNASLQFSVYDMPHGEFPHAVDACDAWLLTGSKASANDEEDWIRRAEELIAERHRQRLPMIGVCFGHQLIAKALGGRVVQADGWGVGVHTQRIVEHQPWMQLQAHELALIVSHQDQVAELPPEATRLATHAFCPNDMCQIGDHILTFQGHPEFSKAFSQALMDRRRDSIGEQTYRQGVDSLSTDLDSTVAARWIVRFLQAAVTARS